MTVFVASIRSSRRPVVCPACSGRGYVIRADLTLDACARRAEVEWRTRLARPKMRRAA